MKEKSYTKILFKVDETGMKQIHHNCNTGINDAHKKPTETGL